MVLSLFFAILAIAFACLYYSKGQKVKQLSKDLDNGHHLKTDFISTVSHELRTPLTSIRGYVKLLLAGDAGQISDQQREFLKIVNLNVDRLTQLINEILDVEAFESGKGNLLLHVNQEDLIPILLECCETFQLVAKQKKLEMLVRIPETLGPISGDKGRLIQIFMNLISNSIKYTEKGFVEIQAEQDDQNVTVRIRDSGIGMNEEDRKNIFQKFYRSRSAFNSHQEGTGLGLVIVRNLVEAHEGKIEVESEPGKGTQFSITFPLSHR